MLREEIIKLISERYYYFLTNLNFEDELYMEGMKEARRKFFTNLHLEISKRERLKKYKDWRFSSDYVSVGALEYLKLGKWESGLLTYDHMVPKSKYIKDVCERHAKKGDLTVDFIYETLNKYLWVATILKKENKKLEDCKVKQLMPVGWDGINIFARYDKAGIKLIEHDKSYQK